MEHLFDNITFNTMKKKEKRRICADQTGNAAVTFCLLAYIYFLYYLNSSSVLKFRVHPKNFGDFSSQSFNSL